MRVLWPTEGVTSTGRLLRWRCRVPRRLPCPVAPLLHPKAPLFSWERCRDKAVIKRIIHKTAPKWVSKHGTHSQAQECWYQTTCFSLPSYLIHHFSIHQDTDSRSSMWFPEEPLCPQMSAWAKNGGLIMELFRLLTGTIGHVNQCVKTQSSEEDPGHFGRKRETSNCTIYVEACSKNTCQTLPNNS